MSQEFFDVECLGIQISADGQRVWVCVDGACVLRVKGIQVLEVLDRTSAHQTIISAIDTLCRDEGDTLLLCTDNVEFGGPNSKVDVGGEWTQWDVHSIFGESRLDCLQKAVAAREAAERKGGE